MHKIIVATGNEGKMRELRQMMKDMDVELVSMKEAGIQAEIVEDGKTFEENALIKARTISKLTGDIVLADDSGLEVDYIGGEPGVYSARYLGEDTPYEVKNKAIIERLKDAEGEERSARFVCVIAVVFPDGHSVTAKGTMEGYIAHELRGINGFGYDPIVYIPEYKMTSGEMEPEFKNSISHRGKALEQMKKELEKYFN